jgi:hypothetical protein
MLSMKTLNIINKPKISFFFLSVFSKFEEGGKERGRGAKKAGKQL